MKWKILLLFLLIVPFSSGHLAAGEDIQQGEYLIDFGWEPEPINAGKETAFAINLLDKEGSEQIHFEYIWLRIADEEGVLFAGNVAPIDDSVAFAYVFPKAGEYKVATRFVGEEETLAEAEMMIEVKGRQERWIIYGILLLAAGTFIITRLIRKKK